MEYLEGVRLIKEVEEKYDVMSVKFKGISVWPMLRTYMFMADTDNQKPFTASRSTILAVLKGVFFYSWAPLFKRHKIWVATSSRDRKIVRGKYINRTLGAICRIDDNALIWESSTPFVPNVPKKSIEEINIVSGNISLLIKYVLKYLLFLWKPKIECEDVLKQICEDYNYEFDYRSYIRRLYAEKKTTDMLLAVLPKPEKEVLICSYGQFGNVWSLKNHGIKVIELQHGVLNAHHYGYNPKCFSKELYPDVMCVMGEVEYLYFTEENTNFCKHIEKVGLYMLDYAKEVFTEDLFAEYRSHYKAIMVVAGQKLIEDKIQHFFEELAQRKPEYLFVYIPREPNTENIMKEPNILFCPGVNIYEYLKWCDLHCTVSSTTCLESQFFSKGTLFWDRDNIATEYYGNVLKPENGVAYVKTVEEANDALESLLNGGFKYRDMFYQGNVERLKEVLEKY